MSQQLIKHQHYLPCKILSAWALNGVPYGRQTQVYVRYGHKSPVCKTVEAVCAQNSLYGYGPLRTDEFSLMLQFLDDFRDVEDEYLRPFRLLAICTTVMTHISNENWNSLRDFWSIASRWAEGIPLNICRAITKICSETVPCLEQVNFFDALKMLTVQGAENYHTLVEDQFWPYLHEFLGERIDSVNDQESFRKVLLYTVDQFMRTNVRSKIMNKVFAEILGIHDVTDALGSYLEPVFATCLTARVAAQSENYHVAIIKTSDEKFVLGDNPVINFACDFKNDPFALFMPISPLLGIFIARKDHKVFWQKKIQWGTRWVKWLNAAICSQSEHCVIADELMVLVENDYYAGMQSMKENSCHE